MMNVGFDSITSLERDFVCSSDGRRLVATGKLIFTMGVGKLVAAHGYG